MNEALTVQIRNPFALREALKVALEATQMDLPERQVSILRRLVSGIPAQVSPAILQFSDPDQVALLNCHTYFRQTRTWYWLREELHTALTVLMIPLSKGAKA